MKLILSSRNGCTPTGCKLQGVSNSPSLAHERRLRHAPKRQRPLPTPGRALRSHNDVEVASSWALWTKSRHRGTGPMAIHRQDTRPAFKLWRGLRSRKVRADQGLANDTTRRRSAAKDALHIALAWKEQGRLAKEWCGLHPTKRDNWVEMHITRASRFPKRTQFDPRFAHGSTGVPGAWSKAKTPSTQPELHL